MDKSLVIFVNGYTHGCEALKPYWTEKGDQFLEAALVYFGREADVQFMNGEGPWYSTADMRFQKGYRLAEGQKEKWKDYRRFYFVTHSMGAAFAEGMALRLIESGFKVEEIVHFSVADAESIRIPVQTAAVSRVQLEMQGDRTIDRKNRFKLRPARRINGVNYYGLLKTDVYKMHPQVSPKDQRNWDFHYDTKTFAYVWECIRALQEQRIVLNPDGSFTLPGSQDG